MNTTSVSTFDVLVGSPRGSFTEAVKVLLKGYHHYNYKTYSSIDALLEGADPSFAPPLAIIDGQDGTAQTTEWVQSTKMSYPDTLVVVLYASDSTIDPALVKKNGADQILHISYDREYVSDIILQLTPMDLEAKDLPLTTLTPVNPRDMEASLPINFDVYVHLPFNHRTILLRKSGDQLEGKQIDKITRLKQQMYIEKRQIKSFFEYSKSVMSLRNLPSTPSITEKTYYTKQAFREVTGQILNSAPTDYQEGKNIFERIRKVAADLDVTKDLSVTDIFEGIFKFTGNTRSLYNDAICMTAYSAYFAQLLGWPEEKRENAAIAGLLHNIGIAQLPVAAIGKETEDFTPEEKTEYQLYPDRSVIMVKNKKVPINPDISSGISEHREYGNGTGFPKKLIAEDISDTGKLLAIAYRFHTLTALQDDKPAMSAADAIKVIQDCAMTSPDQFDLIFLSSIFKKWNPLKR